jgi:hypothetical protein
LSRLEIRIAAGLREAWEMAKWFYIPHKGQRQGPVSTGQLKKLAASGLLQPVDLIWREGMGRWVPARKVQGLIFGEPPAESAKQTPPKPPAAEKKAEAKPARGAQEADWRSALPPRRMTEENAPIEPIEVVEEGPPPQPLMLPAPAPEAPPANIPVASWHNHLPPVRNPAGPLPLDVPLEPVFVDPPPTLLPAPPVSRVPEAIPVKPKPPSRRKKSARQPETKKPDTKKAETKKSAAKKSGVKKSGETPLFCPRCRRANPSFAVFCHFDGIELRPAH